MGKYQRQKLSFGLLQNTETMVTELKYINHANCGWKNNVTQLLIL
jgi:hypothetical protein